MKKETHCRRPYGGGNDAGQPTKDNKICAQVPGRPKTDRILSY